jgi:hypothetical protein
VKVGCLFLWGFLTGVCYAEHQECKTRAMSTLERGSDGK